MSTACPFLLSYKYVFVWTSVKTFLEIHYTMSINKCVIISHSIKKSESIHVYFTQMYHINLIDKPNVQFSFSIAVKKIK